MTRMWRFWSWRVMIWWYFKPNHSDVDAGHHGCGWEHFYHMNNRITGTVMIPRLFTEGELSKRATNRLNLFPAGAEKCIVWGLLPVWENLFTPLVSYFGPNRDFPGLWHEQAQLLFLAAWENKLLCVHQPLLRCAHLKGDAGFFVEVDLSDDSSRFLLHVKDAAAVGRPVQVHPVTD